MNAEVSPTGEPYESEPAGEAQLLGRDEEQERTVDRLDLSYTGRWRVTTVRSTQVFDLNAGTVERFPGPGATYNPDNGPRRLRTIDLCRVGAPGYWTLLSDDPSVEYYWQGSGKIKKIERIADEG